MEYKVPKNKIAVDKHNCEELTGYTPTELARLTGIEAYTRKYHYEISGTDKAPRITLESNDGNVHLSRTFMLGIKEIENDRLEVLSQQNGTGLKIFSEQVKIAKRYGFKKFTCIAARNASMIGHYVWARIGYIIEDEDKEDIKKHLKKNGCQGIETTPHEIVKTPHYREWWKNNRITWTGSFYLNDGSESMKILQQYKKEKNYNED